MHDSLSPVWPTDAAEVEKNLPQGHLWSLDVTGRVNDLIDVARPQSMFLSSAQDCLVCLHGKLLLIAFMTTVTRLSDRGVLCNRSCEHPLRVKAQEHGGEQKDCAVEPSEVSQEDEQCVL